MGFQSVNEIEQFCFDDCVLSDMKVKPDEITLSLDALIVRKNNSQNTNYTESYADTTKVILENAKLDKVLKDGYKYYDANEVLQREVPDVELSVLEIDALLASVEGAFCYGIDRIEEKDGTFFYTISIEFMDEEEQTVGDSYRFFVSFTKAVFTWDRYMNRVQR